MASMPGAGARLPGLLSQPPPPGHPLQPLPPPPQGAMREITCVTLCNVGQETVQDIVSRTMDVFHMLRATQLPNGVTHNHVVYQERYNKLQEHLRQLTLLFKKLRLLYDRCGETCAVSDVPPTELIPFVGEEPGRPERQSAGGLGSKECQEVLGLRQKNQELKHITDQLRNLIWDINSMLAMRN
ncbi:mediator of RNA polymerase II transcription subunit 30-like isoform X1 [Callorhinchus milii]|uniref:mediator of RNA polymerase II transcription subunit 30-like isoform X1 n=1 Tax=Callorhinchus milii TaxID=7868 RepID=UPI001C3F5CF4|nr:mediator of RNA polymerase II transcription subunit 30-like isoform X1 [Callorhinchus milii]